MILSRLVARRPLGVLIAALLAVPPLAASLETGYFQFGLTLHDTDPKFMPIVAEVDGQPKDVQVRHRAKFGTGADRRLRMRALEPDAGASEALLLATTSPTSGSVRVAIDSLQGLVHGDSLAWLERRPTFDEAPVLRLEAVWNAEIDGITLRAKADGEPFGELVHLPGEREVTLHIGSEGGLFLLEGSSAGGTTTVGQIVSFFSDARWAWGCEGLQPKGTFWFTDLSFGWAWEQAWLAGTVEGGAEVSAVMAREELLAAASLVAGPPPVDLFAVQELLQAVDLELGPDHLLGALLQAAGDGELAPTTPGTATLKLAHAASELAHTCSVQAASLLDAGAGDASKLQPRLQKLQRRIELLMGRLMGFKSGSHARLMKSSTLVVQ